MKAALASKAAWCICPTALVAAAVTTVPPIRHAVHHATRPAAHSTVARAKPQKSLQHAAVSVPCLPSFGPLPAVFAPDVPIDPVVPAAGRFFAALPVDAMAPSVPEPNTWLLMVGGFAIVGGLARKQSRPDRGTRRKRKGFGLLSGLPMRARAATVAGVAVPEATGVTASAKSALIAKLALCVCPPVLVAGAVATVPPMRHAIHNATASRTAADLPQAAMPAAIPCDPLVIDSPRDADSVGPLTEASTTTSVG
jgi:hypothetical protein